MTSSLQLLVLAQMSPTVDPGSVKGHAGWVAGSKAGPGNNHAVAHNLKKKKNGVRHNMSLNTLFPDLACFDEFPLSKNITDREFM